MSEARRSLQSGEDGPHPLQLAYEAARSQWRAEVAAYLGERELPGSPSTIPDLRP